MPFGHLHLRPKAKEINGIDDVVELPNVNDPSRWESNVPQFFELTWPTIALRQAVRTVIERFVGTTPGRGVFYIESQYGTGKSHFLLTLSHVLSGHPAVQQWVLRWPAAEQPQSLPADLVVYAHSFVERSPGDFVNDVLLPWLGLPPAPGRMVDVQLIAEAIANSPRLAGRRLVLVLDELARWFTNLKAQPDLTARAEAFLQAAGNYANRSDKLTLILSALPASLPTDVQAVIVRNAVSIPIRASDQQCVILHRIFENYDPQVVPQQTQLVVESFRNSYVQAGLPTGEVTELCDGLLKSYPMHPDFMKLVLERFPKGSNFQNERGALNFVARVVSLAEDRNAEIVTTADADVCDYVIRKKLSNVDPTGTDLPNIAHQDLEGLPDRTDLHGRVMATVLCFSLVDRREPGATREDVLRACVRPGLAPNDILASLKTVGAAEHVWPIQDRHVVRDRRNPAHTVAIQAKRELQRNRKPSQDYIMQTSVREVFGGAPLVYSDLATFDQALVQLQHTLNPSDVKFVITTRRLSPAERQAFFQGRDSANLYVMVEPLDASYDLLTDEGVLFEAAKAMVAERLAQECEATPAEARPYKKENEDSIKQIKEHIQGAYGRVCLWKTQPVIYDAIELDTIQLRGNKFTYDKALEELKGFAGDAETHRRDVLSHIANFRGQSVPDIEKAFRDTLGLHVPVPKEVVGDTLIGMAQEYEISLEHPSHTYCGPDNYGHLTGNQRIELSRCRVADPLPQQAPTTIQTPQTTVATAPAATVPGVATVNVTVGAGAVGGSSTGVAVAAAQTAAATSGVAVQSADPENIGPVAFSKLLGEVQSRIPVGATVEYAECSIEVQDSVQPSGAQGWDYYAGAVDKPTDVDLGIKLTRHAPMTRAEVEQWVGTLPAVPNAEYRMFLRVRRPNGAGA
jgi:hypothetical protein